MDNRPNFHHAIEDLQTDIVKMGHLVEHAIHQAVESLVNMNEQLAEQVVNNDDIIDQMTTNIEERCLRLIALQQPMASDLRTIGTALKIITDLERIADHAVDISKTTMRLSGEKLVKPLIDIPRMAEIAKEMLRESLESYTERNVNRAAALAVKDDEVDKLYSTIFQDIVQLMGGDYSRNRQLTHLLMVAQYIERVADHTTNIGEGVIFMVSGKRKDLNV
jgi:phosphate transport system protein